MCQCLKSVPSIGTHRLVQHWCSVLVLCPCFTSKLPPKKSRGAMLRSNARSINHRKSADRAALRARGPARFLCPTTLPACLLLNWEDKPEPQAVVREVRRVPVAARSTNEPRGAAPAATAKHTVRATLWPLWIYLAPRIAVILSTIPI